MAKSAERPTLEGAEFYALFVRVQSSMAELFAAAEEMGARRALRGASDIARRIRPRECRCGEYIADVLLDTDPSTVGRAGEDAAARDPQGASGPKP